METANRRRLSVIASHLFTPPASTLDPKLHASPVSAQGAIGAPGNRAGRLTVLDERTRKTYTIDISQDGTVRAIDLKKVLICVCF